MSHGASTRPRAPLQALHVHLSKLRGLLAEAAPEPPGTRSRRGSSEVDVWRLDHSSTGPSEPDHAAMLLPRRPRLFRGEPPCDAAPRERGAMAPRPRQERPQVIPRAWTPTPLGGAGDLAGQLERLLRGHEFQEWVMGQLIHACTALVAGGCPPTHQRPRLRCPAELGLEPVSRSRA